MNRLSIILLTLFLSVGVVSSKKTFEVNTRAQWETWNFPVGTVDIGDDGSIKPVRFEQPFNAAPSSPLFSHDLKAGVQRGGVWKTGSNEADANLIIDDDINTYWQPSQDDDVDKWWLEIDLGRMVAVKEVRLHFPDEDADDWERYRAWDAGGVSCFCKVKSCTSGSGFCLLVFKLPVRTEPRFA